MPQTATEGPSILELGRVEHVDARERRDAVPTAKEQDIRADHSRRVPVQPNRRLSRHVDGRPCTEAVEVEGRDGIQRLTRA